MYRVLALIAGWLLDNALGRIFASAGLSLVSYLGVLASLKATFDLLMSKMYEAPADILGYLGYCGVDQAIGAFMGAGVFVMTLKKANLVIRKL